MELFRFRGDQEESMLSTGLTTLWPDKLLSNHRRVTFHRGYYLNFMLEKYMYEKIDENYIEFVGRCGF